jgi:hypothetical protein
MQETVAALPMFQDFVNAMYRLIVDIRPNEGVLTYASVLSGH